MDGKSFGLRKIPEEVRDAFSDRRALEFYVLCEKHDIGFDVFGDDSKELYFLGEMEFDVELDRFEAMGGLDRAIKTREDKYLGFLEEVRSEDVPVRDWSSWMDTKRALTEKYFPGKFKQWENLEDAKFGYRFSKLVEYSKKLESRE